MNNKSETAKLCLEITAKVEQIHEIAAECDEEYESDAELLVCAAVVLQSVSVGLDSVLKKAGRRCKHEQS